MNIIAINNDSKSKQTWLALVLVKFSSLITRTRSCVCRTVLTGEMSTPKGLLQSAEPIAETFREEVKNTLAVASRIPKLVGILSASSAPSRAYAEFTKKQCEALGVAFDLRAIGAASSGELGEGEGVEEAIIEANEDDSVDGIMVCLMKISRESNVYSNYTRCITLFLECSRSVVY